MDLEETIDKPAVIWFWPIRKDPTANSDDEDESVAVDSEKVAADDGEHSEEEDHEVEYEARVIVVILEFIAYL